jgi:signal peptidase II
MRNKTALSWLWLSGLILSVDALSKYMAQTFLVLNQPVEVMPFFNLNLAYNTGAAFSFLSSASGWQIWFFGGIAVIASIAILTWLRRLTMQQRWVAIALCLILGGALGNLLDRFLYGHVIDFVQWYIGHWYWPTFNIADSAICVGAVMLIIDAIRNK